MSLKHSNPAVSSGRRSNMVRAITGIGSAIIRYSLLAIGIPLLIAAGVFCTLSESFDRRC